MQPTNGNPGESNNETLQASLSEIKLQIETTKNSFDERLRSLKLESQIDVEELTKSTTERLDKQAEGLKNCQSSLQK